MTIYYVKGTGERVNLTSAEFIAKGGEKSVYALGGVAYCVYHDPKAAIPADKIKELSVLDRPEIIRPQSELLDSNKRHCGETMPFVSDSFAPNDRSIKPLVLCQLFTNAFRRKHGITNDHIVKISDSVLSIVPYCHQRGVILVDPNETNLLVKSTLDAVRLIDTSCCQTASYRGTAIKSAIRDWNATGFSVNSDYFSIAVVLAWLWVGIHPYLAYHPDWQHMDPNTAMEPRMRKHASFFDKKTEFNRACRPLLDIPGGLSAWLKAVLHDGKRIAPPGSCGQLIAITQQPSAPIQSSAHIVITELEKHRADIVGVWGDLVTYDVGMVIGYTPLRTHPKVARAVRGKLELSGIEITCSARAVFESGKRIYAVSGDSVNEVIFNELSASVRATMKRVGTVADLPTTKVFPGCVLQNLLGKYLLSIFPETGKCIQHQLPGLEGWQVLDAKYDGGVFMATAESGGRYQLARYRIDGSIIDYTKMSDEFGDVNFAVTDKSICAAIMPNGELCAFSAKPGRPGDKRFAFPQPDMTLFSRGPHIVGAVGNVLYRVALT